MQIYNYNKLMGRMKELGYTQESLSKAVGICETTLNLSLNTIRRALRDLVQEGFLKVEERQRESGADSSNKFTLLFSRK